MLSSVRVLDLTNVLAGPFCCHQLAHMGAEIIKVETVGRGDLARHLGANQQSFDQLPSHVIHVANHRLNVLNPEALHNHCPMCLPLARLKRREQGYRLIP